MHVDPPADHKDYMHRAGRTARAGESGTVVTLVLPHQVRATQQMTRRAGIKAPSTRVATGDQELVRLTGARTPSGIPIPEPLIPERPRRENGRGGRPGGGRRGGGGGRGFGGRGPRSYDRQDGGGRPARSGEGDRGGRHEGGSTFSGHREGNRGSYGGERGSYGERRGAPHGKRRDGNDRRAARSN
jgi:superfamily II DNA/RNA helicase